VNGGHGFELTGGDSIAVSNSLSLSNNQHGILVTGGTGVILDGNTCSNNSQQASVTYSGIRIGNRVTGVRVVNNRCGDFIFPLRSKQAYGIAADSATDFLVVTGNDLRGNGMSPINDALLGTNCTIARNLGVRVGGVSAISMRASPFSYTDDDGVPEAVYITGGMVSAVAKNGVTVFTASPCTVYLEPGEAVTVTYSVAPTMNKDRK